MIGLGLSAAEQATFHKLLTRSHRLKIRVQMMDLSQRMLGDISESFINGSVDIDAEAAITRSLKLNLFDPDSSLNFDTTNPNAGAMYLDRMIRIWYCVADLAGSRWYEVPVFTGPVTKVDRDGVLLQVECQGKEVLSQTPFYMSKTYKTGYLKSSIIADFMRTLTGEQFFRWTAFTAKTGAPVVLDQSQNPMGVARNLAFGMNAQLFYDGMGNLTLRPRGGPAVWVFTDEMMTGGKPQVGYSLNGAINAVDVTGATPKGSKRPIRWRITAPKQHPLSPSSLSRGGVNRTLTQVIKDDSIKTLAEAQRVAQNTLNAGLLQTVDMAAQSVVIPHLEEADVFKTVTSDYAGTATMKKFSIPLNPDATMSIGYLQRPKPSKLSTVLRRR